MPVEAFATFLNKKISDNNKLRISTHGKCINGPLDFLNVNLHSFINDIIGDGIDRVSQVIPMASTHCHEQNDFEADNQLSSNTRKYFQQNESDKELFNFQKRLQNATSIKQQRQYPGLVFEKQSIHLNVNDDQVVHSYANIIS